MNRSDCYLVTSLGVEENCLINPDDKVFLLLSSYEDDYEIWFWVEYTNHENIVKDVLDDKATVRSLMDTCKFKIARRYYNNYEEIKLSNERPFGYQLPSTDSYIGHLVHQNDEMDELRSKI